MSKRSEKELEQLKSLGSNTNYEYQLDSHLLETFPNKNPGASQWVSFVCPEFTSLCPKTGQPDFARIFVNYIANKAMVESKSLKLYLFSFRNHGGFHEDCVQTICDDLSKLMKPHFLEVVGEFTPRGGIAIFPYSSFADADQKWQELKAQRLNGYRPGLYSFQLGRPY